MILFRVQNLWERSWENLPLICCGAPLGRGLSLIDHQRHQRNLRRGDDLSTYRNYIWLLQKPLNVLTVWIRLDHNLCVQILSSSSQLKIIVMLNFFKGIYCRVPPLQGLLFSVAWGHVEGLCKSGLSTMRMKPPTWVIHFKLNCQQLPIVYSTQSLTIYYKIITEGRSRQYFYVKSSICQDTSNMNFDRPAQTYIFFSWNWNLYEVMNIGVWYYLTNIPSWIS